MKRALTRLWRGAREHWVRLSIGALLALVWGGVHVALVPYLIDDTFIHLRVAEQLLATGRPHFNAGDAFKTSSSTPFVLLLALLRAIAPDSLLPIALVCSLVALAHAASSLTLLQRLLGRALGFRESALVLLSQLSLTQMASVIWMETALALLFATRGLIDHVDRRPRAFLWLSLAACTRLELVLLLGFVALAALVSRRRLRACLGWAALGAGPFCMFDLVHYGTVIPHAAIAKNIVHQLRTAGSLSMLPPEAVTRELHLVVVASAVYLTLGVALAVLPLFDLRWSRSKPSPGAEVVAAAGLAGLAIATSYVVQQTLVFAWYRPLYLTLLFVPALFWTLSAPSTGKLLALALLLLPLAFDFGNTLLASAGKPERLGHFLEGARARRTRALAVELQRKYPNAVLLASEIGAVGYGFRGRVEDAAGLASDRALEHYPLAFPAERAHSADAPVPRALLAELRPGLVLAVDRHLNAVLRDPIRAGYVHERLHLYEPADEARRASEQLLWNDVRYLDLLVRRDLWQSRQPGSALELPGT